MKRREFEQSMGVVLLSAFVPGIMSTHTVAKCGEEAAITPAKLVNVLYSKLDTPAKLEVFNKHWHQFLAALSKEHGGYTTHHHLKKAAGVFNQLVQEYIQEITVLVDPVTLDVVGIQLCEDKNTPYMVSVGRV